MPGPRRAECDDPPTGGPARDPVGAAFVADPVQPVTKVDPLPQGVGRRLVSVLVVAAIVVLLIVLLFDNLREFFEIILLSLFLSFAIEPAVNWLARHGWKRGLATGAIFLAV